MDSLPDVQKLRDSRGIDINRVGVENILFPLYISTKEGDKVLVTATINLYGSLKHDVKGVNMSRFMEILMAWKYKELSSISLHTMLSDLRNHLGVEDVEDVYAEISFPYFITKRSPVSRKESVMDHKCSFIGRLRDKYEFWLKVKVLTSSSCPCSREISEYGAHNQRSFSTVTVKPLEEKFIWLEDLITLVENCGSCQIYSLLKRSDEKYVTEKAYENSKFCEDIARDVSVALQDLAILSSFKVKVANEESIHPHDAVSYVSRKLENGVWVSDKQGIQY